MKALATANMLILNDSKTQLMLVVLKRDMHLHSLPTSVSIDYAQIYFNMLIKICASHVSINRCIHMLVGMNTSALFLGHAT